MIATRKAILCHVLHPASASFQAAPNPLTLADALLCLRNPSKLAAFKVQIPVHTEQQMRLAGAMQTLNIHVCCIEGTSTQNSSSAIRTTPVLPSNSLARVFAAPSYWSSGSCFGQLLAESDKHALSDWISVNNQMRAARFRCSFNVSKHGLRSCNLSCHEIAPWHGVTTWATPWPVHLCKISYLKPKRLSGV